ncbi:MAG: beta-galactosidase [Clostridia bacterium]|nr:beta-galactosidase [Clostridia bacterium]
MKASKVVVLSLLIVSMLCTSILPAFALTDSNGVNVSGWTEVRKSYDAEVTLDGTEKYDGNYSLRLSSNTLKDASNHYLNMYTNVAIKKGKTYEYGCVVKADKGSDVYMYFDAAMNLITPFSKTFGWTEYKFTYTYTGPDTNKQMGFIFYNKMKNVWIDRAYIYELDENGKPAGPNLMSNGSFESGAPAVTATGSTQNKCGNIEELSGTEAMDYVVTSPQVPMQEKNITVDGFGDDWADIDAIKLNEYYRFGTYSGDIVMRADYKIAYDDKNFYFYVAAKDALHHTDTAYYWQADSIQIMLSKTVGEFGTEVGLMHVEGGDPYCTHNNIEFKSTRKGEETIYEVAIPWGSYIPEKPEPFSFNLMLNENDGVDRRYALEIAQGIGNGKTAQYSPAVVPVSEAEKDVFAFIEGEDEIMTGVDSRYTATIVNFGDEISGELLKDDGTKVADFTAGTGKVVKVPFTYMFEDMGEVEIAVTLKSGSREQKLSFDANAVPSYDLFYEYADKYTKRIADIRAIIAQCEEKGIDTTYETTDMNAVERSLEVLRKQVESDDYRSVAYNLNKMPGILDNAEASLKGYLDGTKAVKDVPKYVSSKIELDGMSFVADTEYKGEIERRPYFFLGYITGWEDRDDIPNYNDFGIGFMPVASVFSDVIGQAEKPSVWKSQGGSAGWADADVIVSDEEAYEGKFSLKMVNRTAAKANITQYIYQNIAAKPNTTYVFGGMVKAKNAKQCSMSFNGKKVNFNGSYDEWTPFKETTTTAENLSGKVLCFIGTSDLTEEIYIDDVYLYEQGSDVNLLENADFEACFERSGDSVFGVNQLALSKVEMQLQRAQFYNIPVILSPGTPSAPEYLLRLSEEVAEPGKNYSVYLKFNPTHPLVFEAIEIYLTALTEMAKDYDIIAAFDLHNEPRFDSSDKSYYLPKYHEYLKGLYGTIENLNKTYGTEYAAFEEIVMPRNSSRDVYYYDWRVFNENIYTEFFKHMHDTVTKVAPDMRIMAKCMLDIYRYPAATMNRGVNYEELSQYFDIAGDDAWAYINQDNESLQAKLEWYDLTGSLTDAPSINSEDHIIIDNATIDYNPNQFNWTRTNIWQGIMHGLCADNTWVWGISDHLEKGIFRNPTYQYRVDCMSAIPRLAYDANRYAYEIEAIKSKPRDVAILYSHPSIGYNSQYMNSTFTAYCTTLYNGLKPGFIGETQTEKLDNYKMLVVPEATNVRLDAVKAIVEFAEKGGKVVVVGKEALHYDEQNNPVPADLIDRLNKAATIIPVEKSPDAIASAAQSDYAEFLGEAFDKAGMKKLVVYDADTGKQVEELEWNWVEHDGAIILNLCNYDWGSTKKVYIEYNGKRLTDITELRETEKLGEVVEVNPYEPLFVRCEL